VTNFKDMEYLDRIRKIDLPCHFRSLLTRPPWRSIGMVTSRILPATGEQHAGTPWNRPPFSIIHTLHTNPTGVPGGVTVRPSRGERLPKPGLRPRAPRGAST